MHDWLITKKSPKSFEKRETENVIEIFYYRRSEKRDKIYLFAI